MAKIGLTKRMLTALACVGGLFAACNGADQPEPTERVREEAILGPCSKHADCEDGNPCTQDVCLLGACLIPLPVIGCCFNGSCNVGGSGGSAGTGGTAGGSGGATAGTGIGGTISLGCSADEQCQDGNPCTQDLCLIGLCLPLPVLGCCYQGVCQDDGSAGAGGDAPIVTGGCSTNEQCDDHNDCTQNLCVLGLCTTLPVLTCDGSGGSPPALGCSTNEECEDGNDCIQNLCLLGLCVALPVIGGVCGGEGGTSGGNGGSAGSMAAAAGEGGFTASNGGAAEGGDTITAGSSVGGSETSSAGKSGGGSGGEAGQLNTSGGTAAAGTNGSGAISTGATAGSAGAAGKNSANQPSSDWAMQGGGCGCKVAGSPSSPGSLAALLAVLTTFAQRRRRRVH